MRTLILLLAALMGGLAGVGSGGDNPFIEKHLASARRLLEEGKAAMARLEVEAALERDDQHLGALELWARTAELAGDADTAAYALHAWMTIVEAAEKSPVPRKTVKEMEERLELLDPDAESFRDLTGDYIKALLKLEKEHEKKGRFHSALAILEEILHLDPRNRDARDLQKAIRRNGAADVATEDLYAGTDPLAGVDTEWIAEEDAKRVEWSDRWTKETEHYRIHTNAGYVILQTAGIAMDQMNQAYRRFFQYKTDGGAIPKIDVNVFKSRDEYLSLGQGPPVEWSAGHFTGSAVETYVSGTGGTDGIRGMYSTLFHEAAHQFVSLTGKGGVPGWLNEAYASFFEGTTILSNGTVRWNQVNNGRLFALAPRLEAGWMSDHADGVRGADGDWGSPERAPSLRILIENEYQWGPPWYAPTWGVVYFLYNYRDPETGIAVLRQPLHDYYLSSAAGRSLDSRVPHFEEMVLSHPDAPVATVDELTPIWKDWLLELRDRQLGKEGTSEDLLHYADLALDRDDSELAQELLEEALLYSPDDPEVMWKLAGVLHELGLDDRASAQYRAFAGEIELRGRSLEDERYLKARKLMEELDPLFQRHKKLKLRLAEDGLELARRYRDRGMPRMALEIARRMSASWSIPEALEFYTEVARESGISLARWKVAYNELTLDGWQPNKGFRAYGKMIEANVVDDPSIATSEGSFQTQELAADVLFDADYSIETELRFGSNPGMMGLCFGRKDGRNTHAVVLHPKGSLDVSTKAGGNWRIRDHQQLSLEPKWNKLRIDVVTTDDGQAAIDVYFDDRWLRSITMPRDSVRGGFGLIHGTGTGHFREIRILDRDPHDPAARIERELALQARMEDPSLRAPGVFQGLTPPPLEPGDWLQGGPLKVEEQYGKPVVIAFWSPYQDKMIPTSAYYASLVEEWEMFGIEVVVVAGNQHRRDEVMSWLEEHPMPGVNLLYDTQHKLLPAYNVVAGGWELPRILLVDVDGTVLWEGDPNLKLDVGWDPQYPIATPLDNALEDLVANRHLLDLIDLAPRLPRAQALFADGLLREALEMVLPLAELDATFDVRVRDARQLRDEIEAVGAELPLLAERAEAGGYPLLAQAYLKKAEGEFPGTGIADLSSSRRRRLERTPQYREAKRAWGRLERAVKEGEGRGDRAKIDGYIAEAAEAEVAEIRAAVERLRRTLDESGAKALPSAWEELQPRADPASSR
jgi:tetratricopeptide (TPR) repeat protein